MRKSSYFTPAFLILFFATFQSINAQIWDGGGDGTNWNDPLNWDTNTVPGAGDFVEIGTTVTLTMSGTGSALAPGQLKIRGTTTRVYLDFDLDVGDPLSSDPAVLLNNGAVFTVKPGRTLIVDAAPTENAIHMNLATELAIEAGAFVIVLQGRRGIQLNQRLSSVTNEGSLSLFGCTDHALLLQEETGFLNGGTLLIDSPVKVGIFNRGGFVNLDGSITINTPGTRGIQHAAATIPSSFTNTGMGSIMISSAGDDGLQARSVFLNDTDASITITNSMDDNIEVLETTFTNHGTINITCRAGAAASGPGLAVGTNSVTGTFINTSNNSLNIDAGMMNPNARSILVYDNGTLTNSGKISTTGGNTNLSIFNRGILTNATNGTIDMDAGRLTNRGTFINNGFITTIFGPNPGVNTNNGGSSTNNAFFRYDVMSDFSAVDMGTGSLVQDFGTDLQNSAETTIDFGGSCDGTLLLKTEYMWMSGAEVVGTNSEIDGSLTANPGSVQPSMQISPSTLPAVVLNLINVCAAALPIELLDFKAVPNDKTVVLQWQTASELNNDYMAVERSADGRNFTEIGRLAGLLESQEIQQYELEDSQPLNGTNYYRLRQVDTDGTTTYSDIISVEFKGERTTAPAPGLYPNVIVAGNPVDLDLRAYPIDTPINLAVFDLFGRSWPLQTQYGGHFTTINLPELPAGTYTLHALNIPDSAPFRFMVIE